MDAAQTDARQGDNGGRPARDNLFRVLSRPVEVRAAENGGQALLRGWLIRYNEPAEIDSLMEGHFIERFAPGSMKKTLSERTPKVLFQHGRDAIGKQPIGKPLGFDHSDEGVQYEVELYDGIPKLIESGLRNGDYGISFQFSVVREDRVQAPERSDANPDGIPERTVREAAVAEFGPVTFPAYEGSTAELRSATDEFFIQRLAAEPERLRRLIEWLDQDATRDLEQETGHDAESAAQDGGEAHLEDGQDGHAGAEQSRESAPPEADAGAEPHLSEGRRDDKGAALVLPVFRGPEKRGVLPNREQQGDERWRPIRLP